MTHAPFGLGVPAPVLRVAATPPAGGLPGPDRLAPCRSRHWHDRPQMCGRYAIAPKRADAWASVKDVLGASIEAGLARLAPRHNVAPSQQVPIVIQTRDGTIQALAARWGYVPTWWRNPKLPTLSINARIEEAEGKPMWKAPWRGARCLVPATHWYEWRQVPGPDGKPLKQPHALELPERAGFMFAGLWSTWTPPTGPRDSTSPIITCAIVTRAASASVSPVHDRMPVILHPNAWLRWLDPHLADPAALKDLLELNAVLEARAWRVSPFVNKPANDGPDCLEPLPD